MQNIKKNLLQCVVGATLMLGNIEVSTITEDELNGSLSIQSPASLTSYSGWALSISSAYACDNNSCEGTTSYPDPPPEEGYWDPIFDPYPGGDGDESGNDGGAAGDGSGDNDGSSQDPNLPPHPGSSLSACNESAEREYNYCKDQVTLGGGIAAIVCGGAIVWQPIAGSLCGVIAGGVLLDTLNECHTAQNASLTACENYFENMGYSGGAGESRGGAGVIP